MRSIRTCRAEREPTLRLGELRRSLGISQVELAARMGISQPHIAKLEQQEDMHLSTLRRYLEGAGGQLRLFVEKSGKLHEIALPETSHATKTNFNQHNREMSCPPAYLPPFA